jgi:hypothetical protein
VGVVGGVEPPPGGTQGAGAPLRQAHPHSPARSRSERSSPRSVARARSVCSAMGSGRRGGRCRGVRASPGDRPGPVAALSALSRSGRDWWLSAPDCAEGPSRSQSPAVRRSLSVARRRARRCLRGLVRARSFAVTCSARNSSYAVRSPSSSPTCSGDAGGTSTVSGARAGSPVLPSRGDSTAASSAPGGASSSPGPLPAVGVASAVIAVLAGIGSCGASRGGSFSTAGAAIVSCASPCGSSVSRLAHRCAARE